VTRGCPLPTGEGVCGGDSAPSPENFGIFYKEIDAFWYILRAKVNNSFTIHRLNNYDSI
jgi:hypothetical protein